MKKFNLTIIMKIIEQFFIIKACTNKHKQKCNKRCISSFAKTLTTDYRNEDIVQLCNSFNGIIIVLMQEGKKREMEYCCTNLNLQLHLEHEK